VPVPMPMPMGGPSHPHPFAISATLAASSGGPPRSALPPASPD
jgi:hypothetical protein